MMSRCRHPGCPARYVTPGARDEHEKEKHVECSCGSWFSYRGINQHIFRMNRRNETAHAKTGRTT